VTLPYRLVVLAFLVTLTMDAIHNLKRFVRWYRRTKR
jgi:hypothetical protein